MGKKSPGARFREEVEAEMEFPDAGARTLLDIACRALDRLHELEAAVAQGGLTVVGSQGQPVANPLLDQIRKERSSFAALWRALEPEDVSPSSRAGRSLASRRWRS